MRSDSSNESPGGQCGLRVELLLHRTHEHNSISRCPPGVQRFQGSRPMKNHERCSTAFEFTPHALNDSLERALLAFKSQRAESSRLHHISEANASRISDFFY